MKIVERNLKKIAMFLSVLMMMIVVYPTMSLASAGVDEEELEATYGSLEELTETNRIADEKIDELLNEGYIINEETINVGTSKFINYEKGNEYGLVQFDDNYYTMLHLEMNDDETLESAYFQNAVGKRTDFVLDENGKIVDTHVDPQMETFLSEGLCDILVGSVGTTLSLLYSKIAGMIGGPIAKIVVGMIVDFGWGYVLSLC